MSINRINCGPRMSSAVVHGNTVYLAGLTADDRTLDVKGQTKQILDKIDKFLAEAGTDKSPPRAVRQTGQSAAEPGLGGAAGVHDYRDRQRQRVHARLGV